MLRLLPLTALLALSACAPSYEGTIDIAVGPELAATGDDLQVVIEISQAVDDIRFVVSRDGTEFARYGRGDEAITTERHLIEGARFLFTIPAAETAKGQVWTVDAVVTVGKSETTATGTLTIGNTPPTASVTLTPEQPQVTMAIVATSSGADVDDDALTYAYAWSVNDQPTDVTGAEFPAGRAVRGDIVTVTVTANDGDDDSAPATASVTVRNGAPTAAVTLTPEAPNTTDTLFAVASGEDPDNDELTFEYGWRINGEVVAGISPEFPSQRTTRGDVIEVTVVARDGRTISEAVTDTVTIGNSPPGAAEVSISQSPSGPERDLVCRIDVLALDPDRDPLTYRFVWTRDAEAWTGPTDTTLYAGDTISSADTRIGETWTCRVLASDGDLEGPGATATSEIVRWTGTRTFTNCRATKEKGPSQEQCDTAYAPTPLEGEVEIDGGIQLWTVPATGTYRIEAFGAAAPNGDDGYGNGNGAKVAGNFSLVAGEILQIAVGQQGVVSGSFTGGGGGTWVVDETDQPLLIAGGGGGIAQYSWGSACGGRSDSFGGLGSGTSTSSSCTAKSYDLALGGRISASNAGSGGGGFNGNGAHSNGSEGGGKGWRDGLTGGGSTSLTAYGGFGGGGCGNGSSSGGGGGGGYSGGDGGRKAGGGGSFNAGTSQSNAANNNDGHGKVTIELLD